MELYDFRQKINKNELKNASLSLTNGGLVIFPTETVYGIGSNCFDINGVNSIYIAKGRKLDNPLIAHISNYEMLNILTNQINPTQKTLMENFWPGPLTIIFKKTDAVPYEVTAGLETVAVRMPSNEIARELIEYAKVPIVAPSANLSGKPSGTNINDIIDEFKDKVDYIIDGGPTDFGLESTVVKVDEDKVTILRPGKITKEDIQKVIQNVDYDKNIFQNLISSEIAESPGMKYRHYAPDCACVMVETNDEEKKITAIQQITETNLNKKMIVLCVDENVEYYRNVTVFGMGSKTDYLQIAKNIFTLLRKANNLKPDLIVIESVERLGVGVAIMNRLVRACSYNVLKIK